ncbi:MAG: hypothetical protein GC168_19105 [Candidatus Hydrogenedens sp.]|nr:hypothetical protein [Candidatus Hydrogenedens sp.]
MAEPQTPEPREWSASAARGAGAVLAAAFLLWVSWLLFDVLRHSLDWSVSHDTPLLLYMGYLMEARGFIPYRDFFDMNLLGSYLSYQAIGHFFGFEDAGVHLADVSLLCALMVCTAAMLWRLGWRTAWLAPMLFSLVYLREGIDMTLQREFLGLLPIALGTACATGLPWLPAGWRAWLAGLAYGCAVTIKPQLALGLPLVVLYLVSDQEGPDAPLSQRIRSMIVLAITSGMGMALPLLAFVGYLVYHGVFQDFVHAAFGYLPLYTQMTGDHRILPPEARPAYLYSKFMLMGGRWSFVLMGYVGFAAGLGNRAHNPGQRRVAALIAALGLAYTIYPVFSGQFWYYHYLPMLFFMSVGAAQVLGPWDKEAPWAQRLVPLFIVALIWVQLFQPESRSLGPVFGRATPWSIPNLLKQPSIGFAPLYKHGNQRAKGGVVDELAAFLEKNVEPGDTVQPLDWAGGGVIHAMLRAKVKIATPFIYYFHFFHHPDSDYIKELKQTFLKDLEEARPRFIIRGMVNQQFMRGTYQVTQKFPEAEAWVDQHYDVLQQRRNYIIYERKPDTPEEVRPDAPKRVPATARPRKNRPLDVRESGRALPAVPEHHGAGTPPDA